MNLDYDSLTDDYIPIVYVLPKSKDNIFDHDIKPRFSINIPYPKFSLGFQHFIHQSKGYLTTEMNKFKDKKKVYYVLSKFERNIDEYDGDLTHIAKKYFEKSIDSRNFYKLWELFFLFNLVDIKNPSYTSVHLCEDKGAFTDAYLTYRDMFTKDASKDKIYTNTPFKDKRMIKIPDDLANISSVKTIIKMFDKKKAQFITGDGLYKWRDPNLQEQEILPLIIGEILTAISIQEKGGVFILRCFEVFTEITTKLIAILNLLYDEVILTKTYFSRKSNSEKYIICRGFTNDKNLKKYTKILEELLFDINDAEHKKKQLNEIFPTYEIDKKYKTTIIHFNTITGNRQFQNMNEMRTFIESNNYRGEEYKTHRDEQIEATKFWTNYFLPSDVKKYQDNIKGLNDFVNIIIEKNKSYVDKMMTKLII